MPGVYFKPPVRQEFAKDIKFLLNNFKESVGSAKDPKERAEALNFIVPVIISAFEKERIKGRDEADAEYKEKGDTQKPQALTDLRAGKEKQIAQVFFDCGVHQAFCSALEQSTESNQALPYVLSILTFYSELFIVELDPFDDDIGIISLLTYFLCERHNYYVDIHWQSSELKNMSFFLKGLLSLMSCPQTEENNFSWQKMQLVALNILFRVLWEFPPHRVVTSMARIFTSSTCTMLIRNFKAQLRLKPSFDKELQKVQVKVLAAISIFGLGPNIVRAGVNASYLHSSTCAIHKERCPCDCCEFRRRLIKMVRERDELGVQNSFDAKKDICKALIRGGIVSFITEYLEFCTKEIVPSLGETETKAFWQTHFPSEHIAILIISISWQINNIHPTENFLSTQDNLLERAFVNTLKSIHEAVGIRGVFIENKELSMVYNVLFHLIIYAQTNDKNMMISEELQAFFYQLANEICQLIVEKPPSTSILDDSTNNCVLTTMYALFPILGIVFIDRERRLPLTQDSLTKQDHFIRNLVNNAMDACGRAVSIFEEICPSLMENKLLNFSSEYDTNDLLEKQIQKYYGASGHFDFYQFHLSTVGIMAILVGAVVLNNLPQRRWRFIENPAVTVSVLKAGSMSYTVRTLMQNYAGEQDSHCCALKSLASIVVYRADQATALSIRKPHSQARIST